MKRMAEKLNITVPCKINMEKLNGRIK